MAYKFFSIGNNENGVNHYGFVDHAFNPAEIEDNPTERGDALNKMASSIPTPYARLYLFDTAFRQINSYQNNGDLRKIAHDGILDKQKEQTPTAYHYLVSECLDMLEFIYLYGDQKKFGIMEWDVDSNCNLLKGSHLTGQQDLGQALQDAHDNTVLRSFDKIYLFTWKGDDGQNIVLGGTSPITLVYTSPNVRKEIQERCGKPFVGGAGNILFDSNHATPLHKRSEDFRKFLYNYRLCDLQHTNIADYQAIEAIYTYINDSKVAYDEKMVINMTNPRLDHVVPLSIGGASIKTAGVSLYCSHEEFDPTQCDYVIRPTAQASLWNKENIGNASFTVYPPLALTENGVDGFRYAGRVWKKSTDIIPSVENNHLSERILPGTTFRYPYISVDDFLEPKIFEVSYNIRKEMFYTGSVKDVKYLLPLKKEFFKFFRAEDIDDMVSMVVDEETENVKVTIKIPLVNGNSIIFEKTYHESDENGNGGDKVMCVDSPMFDLAIFPSYRLPIGNLYDIMLGTSSADSVDLKFFKVKDLWEEKAIDNIKGVIRASEDAFKTRHFKVNDGFDIIEFTIKDGEELHRSIIVPKFRPLSSQSSVFTFCVDFGTTNTHIAYTRKLTGAVSNVRPNEINKFDIEPYDPKTKGGDPQIMLLNSSKSTGYFLKFLTYLKREFVPTSIGKKDGIHYPMRTTTWEVQAPGASLELFTKENIGFNYDNELVINDKLPGIYRTNIKWGYNDILSKPRLTVYFTELLWMMKNKVELNEGGDTFTVIVTYPQSMSVPELQSFKAAWHDAITRLHLEQKATIKYALESITPYYSFLSSDAVIKNYGQPYLNMDIGGGTTDILHVKPRPGRTDSSAVFSALFAANDIWGDGISGVHNGLQNGFITFYLNSTAYKALPDSARGQLQAVMSKPGMTSADFISYLFSHDDDKLLPTNFSTAIKSSPEMMRIPIVHFASLIYYVALTLDLSELDIPSIITFTGMGSKYIKLITTDEETLGQLISNIFTYYGRLVDNEKLVKKPITVIFAPEPKLVTANGGLVMNGKPGNQHLMPDVCLCHGYVGEEFGTSVKYREMESKRTAVLEGYKQFCSLFKDENVQNTLAKLNYSISDKFCREMESLGESSYNFVITNNSSDNGSTNRANFPIGDPMFFWPLKETLYLLGTDSARNVVNNMRNRNQ